MATSSDRAADEFDFSRQPATNRADSDSPHGQNGTADQYDDSEIPKNKRIACVICRKRKLKCDGNRPKCATCARLKHNCAYDEVRRKSGPKRGYVKELEARLAQVEAQVQHADPQSGNRNGTGLDQNSQFSNGQNGISPPMPDAYDSLDMQNGVQFSLSEAPNDPFSISANGAQSSNPDLLNIPEPSLGIDDSFSWEMIGLGLEEPMPTQEAIDELTNAFFEKCHPSLPMLQRYRYQTAMTHAPQNRPPICLRYAIWTHAASITDKYMHHQEIFYRRARKYVEMDEMKGAGEAFVSVAHAQTWTLLCAYEFKMMYFPRAWMSSGRASRLVLMMGLNRVDGLGLDVKQCLPPPQDWTEREERRRTFWLAYCCDRYASIGTGWPMCIDERDIKTNLPASEEAYASSQPQKTAPLSETMTHEQVAHMSSLAAVVYVSHFFGLNLVHLHRPEADDGEDDLSGAFWKRHRHMDNMLLNTSLSLPSHLRLPAGVRNSNIVFLNFAIHAATICLHQAAIFKAEKNQLSRNVIEQSRARCILAASEIATVMRLTSHLDVTGMNPFMAFCLYVAARVFVQYLKKTPNDQEIRTSLEFMLTAMSALKRKNPLTESFMVQLNLDIQGSGLDILLHNPDFNTLQSSKIEPDVQERLERSLEGPAPKYCSPAPFMHGGGSGSSISAEDAQRQRQTPSIRSESPRQTQYAFRNIELQARESRQVPSYETLQASQPGRRWTTQPSREAPVGVNPIFNNNVSIFDVDMTDTSNSSFGNSAGVTPQSTTTYQSNNTSYSPPIVEDEITANSQQMRPNVLTPSSDGMFSSNVMNANSPNGILNQGEPYKLPANWDIGAAAMTPGFSEMTPDGTWDQMMNAAGMVWDDQKTGMTPR